MTNPIRFLIPILAVLWGQASPCAAQGPVCRISGEVVDASGLPVVGAGVILGEEDSLRPTDCLEKPLVRTDAAGRFSIDVARGSDQARHGFLLVHAGGFAARPVALPRRIFVAPDALPDPSTIDPAEQQGTLHEGWIRLPGFRLVEGANVSGRVVDEDGTPITGARITAQDLLASARFRGHQVGGRRLALAARSDDEGWFRLPGVAAAGAILSVESELHHPSRLEVIGTRDDLQLVMERAHRVSGRVVDQEGQPVSATVQVLYEGAPDRTRVRLDEDGRFSFHTRHGSGYRLQIDPQQATAKTTLSPTYRGAQEDLELVVDPADPPPPEQPDPIPTGFEERSKMGFPVTVVDRDTGAPLRDFKARVVWQAESRGYGYSYSLGQAEAARQKAEQPGYIRLEGPPRPDRSRGFVGIRAEGYALFVQEGLEWDHRDLPRVEARLIPESSIAGIVLDGQGDTPLANAPVYLAGQFEDGSGYHFSTSTDAEGRFDFRLLGAGRYTPTVQKDERSARAKTIDLGEAQRVEGIVVRIPPAADIRGRIAGVEIEPGMQVELLQATVVESMVQNPHYQPTGPRSDLGADGSFRFEGIPPQVYEVMLVIPSSFGPAAYLRIPIEPIRVRSRDLELQIDASWDRPGVLGGRIRMPGVEVGFGRLLVVARRFPAVDYYDRSAVDLFGAKTLVDGEGHFELELAPGSYLLRVLELPSGIELMRSMEPVAVGAGKRVSADLDVELVEVRVQIESDKPSVRGDAWLGVHVDSPESNVMRVFMSSGNTRYPAGVPLPAGAEEVVLRLPPRATKLRVSSSMGSLHGARGADAQLGEVEFAPELGRVHTVKLAVKIPDRDEGKDQGRLRK